MVVPKWMMNTNCARRSNEYILYKNINLLQTYQIEGFARIVPEEGTSTIVPKGQNGTTTTPCRNSTGAT